MNKNNILETEDYILKVGKVWNTVTSKEDTGYLIVNKRTEVEELEHCQLGMAMELTNQLQQHLDNLRGQELAVPQEAQGPTIQ